MLNATLGPPTPLPPAVRAAMPTARDISGHDVRIAVGGNDNDRDRDAARQPAAERFGTTADLTGRRRRGKSLLVMAAVALGAASAPPRS